MSKLLSFYGHRRGEGPASRKTGLVALDDDFDALVRTLRVALSFLDQIEVKLEELDQSLPTQRLRDQFEKQRNAIAAEISRVYRDVAPLELSRNIKGK